MAEEGEGVEVVESEAREIGWMPKEEWQGDESKWVDAATFLERGKQVLPILRKTNQKLHTQLTQLNSQVSELVSELRATKTSLKALEESHEADVAERVKGVRAELKAQLIAASKDGDHERVAEITDQMTQLTEAEGGEKESKGGKKKEEPPAAAKPTAEFLAWQEANPDYGTDVRFTQMANAAAQIVAHEHREVVGTAKFFDKVDEELAKMRGGGKKRGGDSKVSGGSNGGARKGAEEGGSSYADLPPEAKAACDSQARNRVGKDRAYKDMGAWRARYAEIYFKQGAR